MEVIKHELKMALTQRALKLRCCYEHDEAEVRTDDALAETPRSSTQVATECTTTEHATAEFCLEAAMAETLHPIKAISGDIEILMRVVYHACHSEQCVSHRVVKMCQEAMWKTSGELCNDQPYDACGYIGSGCSVSLA